MMNKSQIGIITELLELKEGKLACNMIILLSLWVCSCQVFSEGFIQTGAHHSCGLIR